MRIDLKQYGLADPSLKVDLTTKDGKSQRILLGDDTPTGNAVFASVGGDPRFSRLPVTTKTSSIRRASDLRDKRLFTVNFDKVSQVDFTAKKQSVEFGRSKDAWQILKPRPLRADNFSVEDLVRRLKDAKMDLSAYGGCGREEDRGCVLLRRHRSRPRKSRMPRARRRSKCARTRLTTTRNRAPSPAYTKLRTIWEPGSTKGSTIFATRSYFDFGFDDVSAVEMHDGSKAYSLVKGGADWWSNGKKMDSYEHAGVHR